MSHDCLIGVFESLEDWETAQREMELRGLTSQHFKLLRDEHDVRALAPRISLQTDQAKPWMLWGAAIGGAFGVLGAILAAYTMGSELAFSGAPVVIAFTCAIVGALIGGFSGWGIPRDQEADVVKLLAGRKGVVVRGNPEQLAQAEHALRAADAAAIRYFAESSDPTDRIAQGIDMAKESRPHHAT
ncbi:hypothetical protein LOC68_18775 [Blastopirellula sp. JC732]|uniref:DUF1269 domain-containing protein n=1 Tax=Blastopirellula sediminis TaxID=2894196 RepID=A0A9X1MPH5_9BACT|nr:hypothetical protein [Blastopirellula sediminis]MCC9606258.1 hypothetical protein [Blastopirellula sediminis]MCC9630444.1 hypothetical protein [Blastopirellula sediminis]